MLSPSWNSRTLPTLHRRLLAWFDAHQRDLPWRKDRDPYRIWVSEVMLQQTTVAAVGPYFERFLQAFPTITTLAAADEQDVLRLWAGLGYYRRARHLHAAAKQLAADHGEALPDDLHVWAELPGVGRYILGAVLSQAFDRRLPIVEANTLRVLSRLFAYRGDPRSSPGQKWLWQAAETILPRKRVGDFNQAMMELGAIVCTPTSPNCRDCPIAKACEANRLGLQAEIPLPPLAKPVTEVREVAVIVRDGAKVLLCRRPATATRWADFWEFPHAELHPEESSERGAMRVIEAATGYTAMIGEEIITVRHGVTRWRITMTGFLATRTGGAFRSDFYTDAHWVEPGELASYPLSSPQRRLIAAFTRGRRQLRLC